MNRIVSRGAMGLKLPKAKPNPEHLKRVRQLPCVICFRQPVETHHVIHDRFSQRRVPDEMTIPLCPSCHAELHSDKAKWREINGPDYEFIPVVHDMLAGQWP